MSVHGNTIAFVGYAAAAACWIGYLATRRLSLARTGLGFAVAAFAVHAMAYGAECVATHAMVIASFHGTFSLLAFLTVLVLLTVSVPQPLHVVGAFVMPLAVLAMGAVVAAPAPAIPPPALTGALFPFHVFTTFLGYAGIFTACGTGIAYLIQENQLKSRRPAPMLYVLPTLDALDRLNVGLAALVTVFLGAGLASGFLYAAQAWGSEWHWEPKYLASLVAWLAYAGALVLRAVAGWRGKRLARLMVIGFVLMLFAFIGVSLLLPVDRHHYL